jgi:hypothetical protein
MISKSDTLSRVPAKNAFGREPSPNVPTIAIFWIKFTRFYPKPFPALGELDRYSQDYAGQRLQAARVKLHGMTIDEWWMPLRSAFLKDKIERIPHSIQNPASPSAGQNQ